MSDQPDRLLIVEDDGLFSETLEQILASRFLPLIAHSIEEAREALATKAFAGVMLDVRLGGTSSVDTDGIVLLKEIKESRPLMPVIVMTSYGDVRTAVQAMKLGASEFVDKHAIEPLDLCKQVREIISKARMALRTESEAAQLRRLQPSELVGSSPALVPLRKAIDLAALSGHCSVIILGETGAGKEVVAKAIHSQGKRQDGPFVPVHVMGFASSLMESELFGHEKGAFTGANQARSGYIEQADGGILFLDEIGDISADLQVKLLRVLDDRLVYRLGSTRGRPVDIQIIAATHRPIHELVSKGTFREDLYYRLRTVEIHVPPLRTRREDIPLLADHFLHLLRKQGRTQLTGFSNQAVAALRQYSWPGNVRQLRQAVEWAILSAMQETHWAVEWEDLPGEITSVPSAALAADEVGSSIVERARAQAELECIERALIQTSGRKSEAMDRLGYPNRQTMRRRIQQLHDRYPDLWSKYPSIAEAYEKTTEQSA